MEVKPSEVELEPSEVELEPSEVESEPSDVELEPSEMEVKPSEMTRMPSSMELRPSEIRYTQCSIQPKFSGGASLQKTVNDIVAGRIKIEDFPPITVAPHEGNYHSLDNRRLWVFKRLEDRGRCSKIKVKVSSVNLKRHRKFTTTNGGTSIKIKGRKKK
ncbi:Hypothetical predicted protein [Octopus vulgaris]|uniref:Uncharacterized protein n=1 Tax=Octopus vulgaris TaxID=6645 RepID=A0AA36FKX6_OCTVU|nr:Hypothetical predicted protein [Octopus vulgaris]